MALKRIFKKTLISFTIIRVTIVAFQPQRVNICEQLLKGQCVGIVYSSEAV